MNWKYAAIWFLMGTLFGWVILGAALSIGGAILVYVLPLLTLIGLVWVIWFIVHKCKP